MGKNWYTVSQVAKLLQLHEKTVQRFIREGKLKASKVGRSYRIAGHDLSVFAGSIGEETGSALNKSPSDPNFSMESNELKGRATVSAVIDCYIRNKDEAMRISNTFNAVMNSKLPEDGAGRFDFSYFDGDDKGKLIFYGGPLLVSKLLHIAAQLLGEN